MIAVLDPQTVAVIAAVAAPLGAYLVAARRFSGKVNTTEASDLWQEAANIRKWSSERIDALEKRVDLLERGNDALFKENLALAERVRELNAENAALSGQVRELSTTISGLTYELERERKRIAELEGT